MEETFINKFKKSLSNTEDKIFIYEASTNLSYSYLNFYTDTLRICYILNTKYQKCEVVILAGKNSYQYAVYIMATILSGKKLFPLNPEENKSTFKKLVDQISHPHIIFSDQFFLSEELVHIPLTLHRDEKIPEDFFPTGPQENQDLVYIPTSATTGESKIVVQKEKAIISNINALIFHHKLMPDSNIATPLPLFHVNALHFSFFCTFFCGGTITLFEQFDLRKTFQLIEQNKIKILSVIPSILANIARNHDQISEYNIESLLYFVSAAAPLSVNTVKKINETLGKKIIQGYGLSESVNFTCTVPIDISKELYRSTMIDDKFPTIGITLLENQIIILDKMGTPCGQNIEGEITIKSPSLMSSYLNTPSDLFFRNGYLRTGDLGFFKSINQQNFYFISGRIKETAKINGKTISLRELDEQIQLIKNIDIDCISTSFVNDYRGEEIALVCKISSKDESFSTFESLSESLKKLNQDCRPRIIIFSTLLPIRTPSGKAKRWAFKPYLEKYKDHRFLNSIIFINL